MGDFSKKMARKKADDTFLPAFYLVKINKLISIQLTNLSLGRQAPLKFVE